MMLDFGFEVVPKSVSVHGAARVPIRCPVIGALVETSAGWVLLEAGFSRAFLDDGAAQDTVYRSGPRPEAPAGEPLEVALASAGLRVADVSVACVSHLHCDHSGGIPLLARASIPVLVHAEELRFARLAGLADGYYAPDFSDAVDWRTFTGDYEVAPGVLAIETPGHTPGHVSYRVDLPETGVWLLAVDAADLAENLNEQRRPGSVAVPGDELRAAKSLERLLRERERLGARIVPGHDAACWAAVRHPPGGHR
jgi:glyoxylase-like metal-dependent hydrolase (beta-lactamase superfamily II)